MDRRQKAGIAGFLAFAGLWLVTMITVQLVQQNQNGHYLKASLHTPGGPYYPEGMQPISGAIPHPSWARCEPADSDEASMAW